jgi:hypothetical protein
VWLDPELAKQLIDGEDLGYVFWGWRHDAASALSSQAAAGWGAGGAASDSRPLTLLYEPGHGQSGTTPDSAPRTQSGRNESTYISASGTMPT